jgi:hypothetical protein
VSTVEPMETVDMDESPTAPTPGRGRLGRALIIVSAGVVLALVAGGVAAVARDRAADEKRPVDVKARDAAIRTILKHRAIAVLAHDQRAAAIGGIWRATPTPTPICRRRVTPTHGTDARWSVARAPGSSYSPMPRTKITSELS